jgi:hypothetical protein
MNGKYIKYLAAFLILTGIITAFLLSASYILRKTRISPFIATPSTKKLASLLEKELNIGFTIMERLPEKISEKNLLLYPEDSFETENAEPIAVDAVVIVVHPSKKLTNLERETLLKILSGKIDNWKELDEKKAKINLFLPPPDLDAFIKEKIGARKIKNFSRWDGEKIEENDLLIIPFSQLPKSAKLIGYNGNFPTKSNIQQLQYPLSYEIYIAGNKKNIEKVKAIFQDKNFQRKLVKSGILIYK